MTATIVASQDDDDMLVCVWNTHSQTLSMTLEVIAKQLLPYVFHHRQPDEESNQPPTCSLAQRLWDLLVSLFTTPGSPIVLHRPPLHPENPVVAVWWTDNNFPSLQIYFGWRYFLSVPNERRPVRTVESAYMKRRAVWKWFLGFLRSSWHRVEFRRLFFCRRICNGWKNLKKNSQRREFLRTRVFVSEIFRFFLTEKVIIYIQIKIIVFI